MKSNNYKQRSFGFTLIELLVVIAIIGLLASVVLVALQQTQRKGRNAQRRQNMNQLIKSLELYFFENGSYPSTGGAYYGLTSTYGSKTNTGATGYIPNLAPQYIGYLPGDTLIGSSNTYVANTNKINHGFLYVSIDGKNYKLICYHCMEEPISSSDPFYDAGNSAYGVNQGTISFYTPGALTY